MTTQITKMVRPLDPQALIEAHVKATTGVHGVGESGVESKAGAQAKADAAEAAAKAYTDAHAGRTDNPHLVTAAQVGAAPSSHTHASTDITGVPAARVYHNAAQSIPHGTENVTLAFNSERFDTDSMHDVVTNNGRLTCKTAGKYYISANVRFAANPTGVRQVKLRLNGSVFIAYVAVSAASRWETTLALSTVYDLAEDDYVEVVVYQDSGSALNVQSWGNYSPEFMMVRVG